MPRFPPVSFSVPADRFRIVAPDNPSRFCSNPLSVRFVYGVYRFASGAFPADISGSTRAAARTAAPIRIKIFFFIISRTCASTSIPASIIPPFFRKNKYQKRIIRFALRAYETKGRQSGTSDAEPDDWCGSRRTWCRHYDCKFCKIADYKTGSTQRRQTTSVSLP